MTDPFHCFACAGCGYVQKDYHLALRFLGEALVEAPDSEHLNLLKAEVCGG